MPIGLADAYRSPAQRARVVTEGWARKELYCPACATSGLTPTSTNTRAVDFVCGRCVRSFQLKGKSSAFTTRVVDGAYGAMMEALLSDRAPGLFLLQYSRATWSVENLTFIPSFAFPASAVERRKPLAATARRAGWVGCSILLSRIPVDARIAMVRSGRVIAPVSVRRAFQRLEPLSRINALERGWTLDVLNAIRGMGLREFTNQDAYTCAEGLGRLYPKNRHVIQKIRQQLQVLRDAGFLNHLGRGRWQLRSAPLHVAATSSTSGK